MFLKEQYRKSSFVASGYFVIKENRICNFCAGTLGKMNTKF